MIQKTISIAIIGRPNSGKSTLLNKLIGQKISIVTPKVQTTRSIITGIITLKDTQVILYDTPGIFEPKGTLERAMVRCAWSTLHSVDLVMLIIDSLKPLDEITYDILKKLHHLKIVYSNDLENWNVKQSASARSLKNLSEHTNSPQFCINNSSKQKSISVFLLNKIDARSKYLPEIQGSLTADYPGSPIFPISALSGENIDKLLQYITAEAKPSAWLYEEDEMTDLPMRFIAAEITREQLFFNLQQELPYKLTVQTESWERNDKSVKINQIIVVSKESYKTIILGKNGSKIKEIGAKARKEMERFFNCPIHLFLFVKVRELWENNPEFYQHMKL